MEKPQLAIIIPCYNEEENVVPMSEAVVAQMEALPQYDYELIFIDNDSQDSTRDKLRDVCASNQKIKAIFLTHAHFDHIMGLEALKERSGAPVYACIHEKRLCESARLNQSQMIGRPCTVEPDFYLEDNQEVTVADITMKVLFTPGHTEGSCAYYIEDGNILISGDTLFQGSVGRSDLPTGDGETLLESIRTRLYVLPDDTTVFSGHGDTTTIGYEKKHNWFVRA